MSWCNANYPFEQYSNELVVPDSYDRSDNLDSYEKLLQLALNEEQAVVVFVRMTRDSYRVQTRQASCFFISFQTVND